MVTWCTLRNRHSTSSSGVMSSCSSLKVLPWRPTCAALLFTMLLRFFSCLQHVRHFWCLQGQRRGEAQHSTVLKQVIACLHRSSEANSRKHTHYVALCVCVSVTAVDDVMSVTTHRSSRVMSTPTEGAAFRVSEISIQKCFMMSFRDVQPVCM